MFQLPAGFEGLLEPEAGFALVEPTIRAYTEEAVKLGAEVQTGETVMGIRVHKDFVEIHTDKMQYQAQKVVLTAGAYAERLLPSLTDTLTVSRQLIHWIRPDNPEPFMYGNFPAWVLAGEEFPGIYYGFPVLDPDRFGGNGLLKVAHHFPGKIIEPEELTYFDPEDSVKATEKVLRNYLPEALGEIVETSVCMYTNTPDEHFIIDFLPESEEKIVVATGFSGHGFKFVPVIGEVLADLSAEGSTDHPVGFLNLSRFSK